MPAAADDAIARPRRIDLLGVPFNSAGTTDGVARGPEAIRRATLVGSLLDAGVNVRDAGDVELGPTSPERDPASGVIAPAAVADMIRGVAARVGPILAGGSFPVLIGGDCPVLLGCLAGATEGSRSPGLLFVDGHEDAWPAPISTTGQAADMELGWLLGLTVSGLPDELVSQIPKLAPNQVVVFGSRDEVELAEAGVQSIGDVVGIVRPGDLAADPAATVADASAVLGRAGSWWLHVDLDVLSTESLSAVDYPQPGGVDWATLTALTRAALASDRVIGWDITIFNPDLDPTGTDAQRIVRYAVESLAG